MAEPVLYEKDGHVVTITYNRPEKRNAINGPMRAGLNAAWTRFQADEDAWVAIVTGTDPAFCGGADLKEGGSIGEFAGTFWEMPTVNSFESGLEVWKPTIAAVNGPCVGYGLTGVCACDFVLASERATFSYPEVTIGSPTIVGALRLPDKVGMQHALELLLTGDPIDADRAKEIGLAMEVVAHDDLLPAARRLAERLCQGDPLAVRVTKEMAYRGRRMGWTEAVRMGESMRRLQGHLRRS